MSTPAQTVRETALITGASMLAQSVRQMQERVQA
jgi:hypothetical protein